MTDYSVNATLTLPAWITVTADSPDAALDAAREAAARDFDTDYGSAVIDFNVTPAVEVVS